MKMNARKLTIALIALLLALTCVFVACKKDDPIDVGKDDKQETKEPETQEPSVSKEELEAVATQFKKDFNDNYLSLYTDAVATELEALKAEALLKITGASSLDEAKKLAADYIKKLQDAKTIIDEVEDLIAEIGDVALADEEKVALLADYNALVEQKFLTAAGAQKTVIDAYKAETWGTVKAIVARLRTLKVAKQAADSEGGLNDQIAALLAKAQAAKAYEADGEYELDDDKLTLADYEALVVLQAQIDAFARTHELEAGSEAYGEIINKNDLDAADTLFAEKTANHRQINRARNVIEAAKNLAAAAKVAARVNGEVAETEIKMADVQGLQSGTSAAVYFISAKKLEAGIVSVLAPEGLTAPVKVVALWDEMGSVEDPEAVWVSKADLYADLATAWAELNTLQIVEVAITGDSGANNPFQIEIPVEGAYYVLDEDMQAAAQAAFEAAALWDALLSDAGNSNLEESIANTFYNEIIAAILAQYNASMATAIEAYNDFAAALVEMNYVSEYPEKANSYNEYVLETDTTVVPAEGAEDWKVALKDEIVKLYQNKKTPYGQDTILIEGLIGLFNLNDVPNEFYPFYEFVAKYLDKETKEVIASIPGTVTLHKNADGSYTPSIEYVTYTYAWLIDVLSKTEKEYVTEENTDELQSVIDSINDYFFRGAHEEYDEEVNFYELAKELVAWVDKYIENIPETNFDLAPFMTVNGQPVAFGDVKMTFVDEKLEEKAIPQIVEIGGSTVEAAPSAALDITVYADYTVALKAIEEYDRLVAERKQTAEDLKKDLRALFAPGEADAIATLQAEYQAAVEKYEFCVEGTIVDALRVIDEFNYNRYAEVIAQAKALQDRALALYPHTEWNEALAALKEAYVIAERKAAGMNRAIADYDMMLADAEAWLEHCKAGHSVGVDGVRLVDDDTLAAAEREVLVLKTWRDILADASKFYAENNARRVDEAETPNVPRHPATLVSYNENALDEALGRYVDNEVLRDYMIAILLNANDTVQYDFANGVYTFTKRAELDKIALDAALAEAKTAYETKKTEMVENFQIDGEKAYAQIMVLNALIADIDAFVDEAIIISFADGAPAPTYADYDYLNLAVSNEYTGNKIDLFSQIFNERIMAAYYRSLMLVKEYAEEVVDPEHSYFGAKTENWLAKAINTLKEYQKSTAKFTSIDSGKEAVKNAWRFIDVNYEEAVMSIVADGGENASYEELVYEEKNGVEGFQFDSTDVAGYLITATTNPGLNP